MQQIMILVGTCVVSWFMARELPAQLIDSKPLESAIDAVFASYDNDQTPGCAVAVYRDGEIAFAKGYGLADLEHRVRITPGTVFDLGSTSKQFTAACLVLLEQDGALSIDDDVREHVHELPDYGHVVTIRHLLHHTSGIPDYIGLLIEEGFDIDDVTTDADALEVLVDADELEFEPGSRHEYSNSGYFLASVIVRRVTGKSLRRFADERIFQPLGMRHTSYIDDHTVVVPDRAVGYSRPLLSLRYHRDVSYWEQNGDGAVFTTVEDLLRWDNHFYEPEVGGQELIDALLRRGALNDGEPIDYALGLYYDEHKGRELVAHGGSWGGYRANLIRVPSERVSVAVLCNAGNDSIDGLALQVLDIVLPEPAVDAEAGDEVLERVDPSQHPDADAQH